MIKDKLIKSVQVYFVVGFLTVFFTYSWRNYVLSLSPPIEDAASKGLIVLGITEIIIVGLFASLLLAVLSSLLDVFVLRKLFENKSLGKAFALSVLVEIVTIGIVLIITFSFANRFVLGDDERAIQIWDVPDMGFGFILTGIIVVSSRFILEIDQKLGKGNLRRFITGKFHEPRNEHRLFMFLDLKSSTTIAEKIGHHKFSLLLQDCFKDLSVVARYHAEVYQYVGDEVVLIWNPKKGLKNGNYLKAFFAFKKALYAKKNYYEEKYGVFPVFKAGSNIGECTVTEVGELKREISYHGDTLNTAARIEGMCNHYDATFLISEDLKKETNNLDGYIVEEKGCIELKGKKNKVMLLEISEKSS